MFNDQTRPRSGQTGVHYLTDVDDNRISIIAGLGKNIHVATCASTEQAIALL